MADMRFTDPLDKLQYRIFKWVLFIFFLATTFKLVNSEIHITQFVYSMLGY